MALKPPPIYEFVLPLPPTANHRLMPVKTKGGGMRLIKSTKMRDWQENAQKLLKPCQDYRHMEVRVDLVMCWPDRRRRDIDGPVKPVLDVLTTVGIWSDDVWVKDVRLSIAREGSTYPRGTVSGRVQLFVPF